MLSVADKTTMLSVVMMNVVMLSILMLNVVAPREKLDQHIIWLVTKICKLRT
jgi:hypothetical protein